MDEQLNYDDGYRFDDVVELAPAQDDAPAGELSLEEIHREHFAFVWRTVRNLGVPPAALEDAVQDVFLVVHRRLDEFEGRSAVRTWLFSIARRVAHRHRRTATRQRRKLDALAEVEPIPTNLEAELARAEAARILADFLDSLDDAKREVFVLHTLEGITGREIASALGVSVNTVHSRLRLARRSFEDMCRTRRVTEERAIAQARGASEPPSQTRSQAWALLVPMLEFPPGVIEGGASWTLLGQVKLFAVTVAVGTVGLGAIKASAPGEPGLLIPTAAAAAVLPAPAASRAPATPTAPSRPLALADAGLPAATSGGEPAEPMGPRGSGSALGAETRAMQQLRSLINRGDAVAALATLDRLDRELAGDAFEAERAGYRAIALCGAGRAREGRGLARVFLRDHADSPVADRVRADCLGER